MRDSQVHHPKHYKHFGLETIDIIRLVLNARENKELSNFQAYCMGNELKYRLRAGLKPENACDRDMQKALKYRDFRFEEGDVDESSFVQSEDPSILDDGFGNWFDRYCPDCGAEVEVVRPGKVQCTAGCENMLFA